MRRGGEGLGEVMSREKRSREEHVPCLLRLKLAVVTFHYREQADETLRVRTESQDKTRVCVCVCVCMCL